jgi:hypothetical protein
MIIKRKGRLGLFLIGGLFSLAPLPDYGCDISKLIGRHLANEFDHQFPINSFVGFIAIQQSSWSLSGCESCITTEDRNRLLKVVDSVLKVSGCLPKSDSAFMVPLMFGKNVSDTGRMKILVDPIELEKLLEVIRQKPHRILETISFFYDPNVKTKRKNIN